MSFTLCSLDMSTKDVSSFCYQMLEDYGILEADITNSNVNNKLDSMVLLIKRNAELETRNHQLSTQLGSTQADLDREHHKKNELNDNYLSCKQVSNSLTLSVALYIHHHTLSFSLGITASV